MLLSCWDRSTDAQFGSIATSIRKLANGWTPKLMNSAGREVLVKSVWQAIPTFSVSCFRLFKNMCKKLTSLVAGGDENRRKMHRRKWEDIAIPKCDGGMGFRDFELFNQTILAKQGWHLLTNPDSLHARFLYKANITDGDFMT